MDECFSELETIEECKAQYKVLSKTSLYSEKGIQTTQAPISRFLKCSEAPRHKTMRLRFLRHQGKGGAALGVGDFIVKLPCIHSKCRNRRHHCQD